MPAEKGAGLVGKTCRAIGKKCCLFSEKALPLFPSPAPAGAVYLSPAFFSPASGR